MELGHTFADGSKIVKTASTAKEAGSTKVVTHTFTFDLSGCTLGNVVDEAVRSMVITLQGRVRNHLKKHGTCPADLPEGNVTVNVVGLLTGRGRAIVPTVDNVRALLAAMSDEDRERLLANYEK